MGSTLRFPPNLRLSPKFRFPPNKNLKTKRDRNTGASNWIRNTRAKTIKSSKQRWRRNVRPLGENLCRCTNKINSSIIPRRNKNIRPSGWILGRNSNGIIQSVIPKGKRWILSKWKWCSNKSLSDGHISGRNERILWDHGRVGDLERNNRERTNQ